MGAIRLDVGKGKFYDGCFVVSFRCSSRPVIVYFTKVDSSAVLLDRATLDHPS